MPSYMVICQGKTSTELFADKLLFMFLVMAQRIINGLPIFVLSYFRVSVNLLNLYLIAS